MKKYIILYLISILICTHLTAQNAQRADELFNKGEYTEATDIYASLYEKSPKNQLYIYRYARCLQETGENEKAIEIFEQANEKYTLKNFYLGKLYFDTYRFTQAIDVLDIFLSKITDENERFEQATDLLNKSKKAEKYIRRVEDIAIIDSIILPKTEILKAYNISEESGKLITTDGVHFGHINQRQDRKYEATQNENSHLQACHYILDQWTDCNKLNLLDQLSTINYPYMMSDGVTLYFSAITESGLGGYDIYQTKYNTTTDTWLTPENIGMPFNSFANDYLYVIDETKQIGYFATDRRCGNDSVVVYTFIPNQEKKVLHDADDATIRLAAQLKSANSQTARVIKEQADNNTDKSTTIKDNKNGVTSYEIFFPIYNDIVYTKLSDFQSSDARVMFQQWQTANNSYLEMKNTLRDKRKIYAEGNNGVKQSMKTEILALEKQINDAEKQNRQTLNKIRKVEQQALK